MRVLLDECVDRRFAQALKGHEVKTVPDMGWSGVKNGQLLRLAEQEFDVLITVDRSLPSQQDLSRFELAVLVLHAPSNRLPDLRALAPRVLTALDSAPKRVATVVGGA